jgi:hypothetical protein
MPGYWRKTIDRTAKKAGQVCRPRRPNNQNSKYVRSLAALA